MRKILLKLQQKSLSGALLQTLFGMFFGILLVQGAHAQFGGPVTVVADTSPTSLNQLRTQTQQLLTQSRTLINGEKQTLQDYLEYAQEAGRWIETVNHYSEVIIGNVKRFMSLKGVMGVVEQQLGLSEDTLKALADLGQAIRVTIELKNQFIGMVRSRLAMVENLDRRARSGIFDPQADLADLEEYLTSTMGRQARARLQTRAKLAEQDAELERMTVELEKIRAQRTAAEAEKKDINQKLGRETGMQTRARVVGANEDGSRAQIYNPNDRVSLSIEATNAMILRLGQLDQLINDLTVQEQTLMEKIANRYQTYQNSFDKIYFTGEQWKEATDGWLAFTEAKNQRLGELIDTYGNVPEAQSSPTPTR